jgi:hypothetical protein
MAVSDGSKIGFFERGTTDQETINVGLFLKIRAILGINRSYLHFY